MSDSGIAGFEGGQPVVTIGAGNPEALKYGAVWDTKEYRAGRAFGEELAQEFLTLAHPRKGATLTDFGCGTGRGALVLALIGGLNVTMVDFVGNCLDLDIKNMLQAQAHALRFYKRDLETGPLPVGEYGYCTDVMEHIPTDRVPLVLDNILHAAQHVFFAISTRPDEFGPRLIGAPLHLTVRPFAWWLEQFKALDCVIHYAEERPDSAIVYVSAWSNGPELVKAGRLNVSEETVRANVRANINAGVEQVIPHPTNELELMILGGGPSLNQCEDEIKRLRAGGVKLVTLNGAYNWAVDRGLVPSATIIVDARPFDARFVQPVVDRCIYLMASQVDPSVLADLPKDRTLLWHTDTTLVKDLLDAHYTVWYGMPGGPTVLLAAIPLLRVLGYHRFHLFGCDSCLVPSYEAKPPQPGWGLDDYVEHRLRRTLNNPDNQHHAYPQPENEGGDIVPVFVGGRAFFCHPWMVAQAQQFQDLIKFLGDEIDLEVYGDGLLAHILTTAAAEHDAKEASV